VLELKTELNEDEYINYQSSKKPNYKEIAEVLKNVFAGKDLSRKEKLEIEANVKMEIKNLSTEQLRSCLKEGKLMV